MNWEKLPKIKIQAERQDDKPQKQVWAEHQTKRKAQLPTAKVESQEIRRPCKVEGKTG